MFKVGRLQLLTSPGGRPGDLGFKLTGHAREGDGLIRVWLRRIGPWERYLDPRGASSVWDVRVSIRRDSAFELQGDLSVRDLPGLEDAWDFRAGGGMIAQMVPNGDFVHDAALAWARSATRPAAAGASDDADDDWEQAEELARLTGEQLAVQQDG